jgi:hypothetical protein
MKLSNFLHDLTKAIKKFDIDYDCFSIGQLESKEWLIRILKDIEITKKLKLGTVYILCGWYGILSSLIFLTFEAEKIRSFDIDDKCEKVADQINKTYSSDNWKFKAITEDINNIDFEKNSWQCWSNKNQRLSYPITDKPDTIINTSCEHTTTEWFKKIPKGKLVILQSSNFFSGSGHINSMTSLEEFKLEYPLSELYFEGELDFEKYTRYMIIGKK